MFERDLSYRMCFLNSNDGLFHLLKGNEIFQCQMESPGEKLGQAANSLSVFSVSLLAAELEEQKVVVETPAEHNQISGHTWLSYIPKIFQEMFRSQIDSL